MPIADFKDREGKPLPRRLNKQIIEDIRSGKVDLRAANAVSLKERESRDFRVATVSEAWSNLMKIAESLAQDMPPTPDASLWLLSALNRTKTQDIHALIRELGFVEMGHPKQYDRFRLADRVAELIKQGHSNMDACKIAAGEQGCSVSLAYHWGIRKQKK